MNIFEEIQLEYVKAWKQCQQLEAELQELGLLDWMEAGEGPQLGMVEALDLARQTLAYTYTV